MTTQGTHKYRKIAESLRQRIKSGRINTGEFIPSTKLLAREFDTTPVTIDRALGILVSEGLLTRTPGIGTQVVHPAHPVLREGRPAPGTPGLIGAMLQAQTESRFWERLLEGVSDILRPEGMATLIGYHNQNESLAIEHLELFYSQGVRVVLFAPFDRPTPGEYEETNAGVIHIIRDMGMQVIMLDRYLETVPGHFVTEYCYTQGREMVQRLIDNGYSDLLCISTDYVSVIGARERSFIDGCLSRGIKNPEERIIRIPLRDFQTRQYQVIHQILDDAQVPDCFVCLNSRIFNTLIYLHAKGELGRGRNCKFAGFVDIELMDMDKVIAYVE